jgi:hypothetical protein
LGRFGKVWAIFVISLLTLIERGLDVPGILQDLTSSKQDIIIVKNKNRAIADPVLNCLCRKY